jgi:hypothetical protein
MEGADVKVLPMTPDDPQVDLETRLANLCKLGPMEFEPGEREAILQALAEQDALSRNAI